MVVLSENNVIERNNNECNNRLSKQNGRDLKSRLRRTRSVTQVERISAEERKTRRSQFDKPCHTTCDSLFSWTSGFDKFEGFINWGALLLIMGGTRLFLENVLKYGIRVSPTKWVLYLIKDRKNDYYFHTPLYLVACNLHFMFAFFLEKMMSQNKITSKTGVILHIMHLIIITLNPMILCWFWSDEFSLLGRTAICSSNIVILLKLWSYAHVNHWCRQDQERTKKYLRKRSMSFKKLSKSSDDELQDSDTNAPYSPIEYPNNLTLKDLYYFLVAPTLCYELNFPRSHGIRIRFLLRRVLEVFILSNMILGLFQQWIIPSVLNSFKPFSEMNYIKCLERILKLAIPNHLLWLIWFYLFFHSFLNTIGELLKFGDRNFYQDWWNSKNVGTFWKLWNLPVHKWCVRHVFVPLVKSKYSKTFASIIVFSLSAFFHEYLVSVPLSMYKIGVFLGMMLQVPLMLISEPISRVSERIGNVMVWASLIIGQPIAIMIYYHDYIIDNWDPSSLPWADYYEYINATSLVQ